MKKMSKSTMQKLSWIILIVFIVAGVVLGIVFKKADRNFQGQLIQVFDPFIMFCTWLLGGFTWAIVFGRSFGRKK